MPARKKSPQTVSRTPWDLAAWFTGAACFTGAAWGVLVLLLFGLVRLALSPLPDPLSGSERAEVLAGALHADQPMEQTFRAAQDGLTALDVAPVIPPGKLNPAYSLRLVVYEDGQTAPLAEGRYQLVDVRSQARLRLTFPAQPHSAGQLYRLQISTDAPPDTVSLRASDEDVLPDGQLTVQGQPAARDLALRAYTARTWATLLADLRAIAPDYGFLLLVSLACAGCGSLVLVLLGQFPRDDWAGFGLQAMGGGAALLVLGYAVLTRVYLAAGLVGLALALLLALVTRARRASPRTVTRPAADWPVDAALLLLFLLALAARLIQVQGVPVPMWVDGLEHVQMAERVAAAGGLPGGLLYHIGFHFLVSLAHDLTGWPLPRLVLLLGQWGLAFGGLAIYPLARLVSGSRAAAVLAALALTGLATFPAYLTNWARYPFALGLALLPLVLAAWIGLARSASLRGLAWALLLSCGLFLTHYGTLSLALTFLLIWLLWEHPALPWKRLTQPLHLLGLFGLLAAAGAGLYMRFGPDLWQQVGEIIAQSRQASAAQNYPELLRLTVRGSGLWLVLLAGLGTALAWLHGKPRVLVLSLGWVATQAGLTALQAPLFGYTLASYTNLLLASGLPLALLAGYGLAQLLKSAGRVFSNDRHRLLLGGAMFAALALLSALAQPGLLNPTSLLFGPADSRAVAWIEQNTAPQARFLINSNRWGTAVVPSDGGGWLTALTGRPTHFLTARPPAADPLPQPASAAPPPEYIYLGRFSGFLSRSALAADPARYRLVYEEAGVQIYQVLPEQQP